MAYGDEGTVAAPVAVAGDVVTVVEAVEAAGHKIDLTERSSRYLCSYTHIQKPEG